MKFSINSFLSIICIILSVWMILNIHNYSPVKNKIETEILDFVTPVMDASSSGIYSFREISENIKNFFASSEKIKILEEKNKFLEDYFFLYKQLKAENILLREELNFIENLEHKYITAKVIGRTNAASQQMIINSGFNQGVKKGQLVVSRGQLLGRIIWVGKNSAKVLMITDQASRIPAMVIDSRYKFIASGQLTNYLVCKYLNENPNFQVGELVVTNGDNLSIIPGIIIGTLVEEDKVFYIKPNIDFEKVELVQILQVGEYEKE